MSSAGFHEDFSRTADEPQASERSFGLVFSAVFALIALGPLLNHGSARLWALPISALFLILAFAAPRALAVPNRLWMKLGKLLHMIVSPVIMSLLFVVAVVPTAVIIRLTGRDPLRLKFDNKAASYWQKREVREDASFTQQF